jgi:hypothetical protein
MLKAHCKPDEYDSYAKAIAAAVASIHLEVINRVTVDFPALEAEIEAQINKQAIIASRTLKLRQGDVDIDVPVRIYAPEHKGVDWSCSYAIDWPEGTRKFTIYGIDSVQAIELALKMIGSEIYTSEYHKAKMLTWEKPGKGYGFPVPQNMRDLLEGDDAKYL